MAETFLSRFEVVLGDLNSELYRNAIQRDSASVAVSFRSPVRRVVEKIVADCQGLGSHWYRYPLESSSNTSVIVRQLNVGNLSDGLKEVDTLFSILNDIEGERPAQLPTSKSRVLDRYDKNLSQLLALLSALARDETPLLIEKLLVLAGAFYFAMTPEQVASMRKARKLGDRVWLTEDNYKALGKFISLMEPLLKNLYPLEPRKWEAMKTDEVHRLLSLIKRIHGDMEVLELWDSLTTS